MFLQIIGAKNQKDNPETYLKYTFSQSDVSKLKLLDEHLKYNCMFKNGNNRIDINENKDTNLNFRDFYDKYSRFMSTSEIDKEKQITDDKRFGQFKEQFKSYYSTVNFSVSSQNMKEEMSCKKQDIEFQEENDVFNICIKEQCSSSFLKRKVNSSLYFTQINMPKLTEIYTDIFWTMLLYQTNDNEKMNKINEIFNKNDFLKLSYRELYYIISFFCKIMYSDQSKSNNLKHLLNLLEISKSTINDKSDFDKINLFNQFTHEAIQIANFPCNPYDFQILSLLLVNSNKDNINNKSHTLISQPGFLETILYKKNNQITMPAISLDFMRLCINSILYIQKFANYIIREKNSKKSGIEKLSDIAKQINNIGNLLGTTPKEQKDNVLSIIITYFPYLVINDQTEIFDFSGMNYHFSKIIDNYFVNKQDKIPYNAENYDKLEEFFDKKWILEKYVLKNIKEIKINKNEKAKFDELSGKLLNNNLTTLDTLIKEKSRNNYQQLGGFYETYCNFYSTLDEQQKGKNKNLLSEAQYRTILQSKTYGVSFKHCFISGSKETNEKNNIKKMKKKLTNIIEVKNEKFADLISMLNSLEIQISDDENIEKESNKYKISDEIDLIDNKTQEEKGEEKNKIKYENIINSLTKDQLNEILQELNINTKNNKSQSNSPTKNNKSEVSSPIKKTKNTTFAILINIIEKTFIDIFNNSTTTNIINCDTINTLLNNISQTAFSEINHVDLQIIFFKCFQYYCNQEKIRNNIFETLQSNKLDDKTIHSLNYKIVDTDLQLEKVDKNNVNQKIEELIINKINDSNNKDNAVLTLNNVLLALGKYYGICKSNTTDKILLIDSQIESQHKRYCNGIQTFCNDCLNNKCLSQGNFVIGNNNRSPFIIALKAMDLYSVIKK